MTGLSFVLLGFEHEKALLKYVGKIDPWRVESRHKAMQYLTFYYPSL
jgi:hypothetical protein